VHQQVLRDGAISTELGLISCQDLCLAVEANDTQGHYNSKQRNEVNHANYFPEIEGEEAVYQIDL
jgi:hypothetical protein